MLIGRKYNFYKDKKTLILDLDETLIHCNDDPTEPGDVILPIKYENGDIFTGQWDEDENRDQTGELLYSDGRKYVGEF